MEAIQLSRQPLEAYYSVWTTPQSRAHTFKNVHLVKSKADF